MTEDIRAFVKEALTGSKVIAVREETIARLEAEVAHLNLVNRLLIEKLEWFAAYVDVQQARTRRFEVPTLPESRRLRPVLTGGKALCRVCGDRFEVAPYHRTLCQRCRSEAVSDGLPKKEAVAV